MIISLERNLEENIQEGIKTLEYHLRPQNYPIVNKMIKLQIETLQWVLDKKNKNSLESLQEIVKFKVERLEYILKISRDIEKSNTIVYQLEVLECCKLMINWNIQRMTKTTKKEDGISAVC